MTSPQSPRRTALWCEPLEARLALDATSFVTSLYQTLLHRAPDADGLAHYVAEIQNGTSNQAVATDIWRSPEHRGIQVDAFYQTFLNRTADAGGRAHWINQLLNGVSELGVAAQFLTSTEYLASHNTPAAYVNGLYLDVLGRTPAASELVFWENALLLYGDAAATAGIVTSGEAYTDVIGNDYENYLDRSADLSGLEHYFSQLATGQAGVESVAESILGSAEYAAHH